LESTRPESWGDVSSQFKATNCACSFCLLIFSLREPSERDLLRFRRHLQANHGLKLGELER